MSDLKFSGDKTGAKVKSASGPIRSLAPAEMPHHQVQLWLLRWPYLKLYPGETVWAESLLSIRRKEYFGTQREAGWSKLQSHRICSPITPPCKRTHQTGAKAATTVLEQHVSNVVNFWFSLELTAPNFNNLVVSSEFPSIHQAIKCCLWQKQGKHKSLLLFLSWPKAFLDPPQWPSLGSSGRQLQLCPRGEKLGKRGQSWHCICSPWGRFDLW